MALCASALAGAWVHAHFYRTPALSHLDGHVVMSQASRDAAYIRENISALADKVGALQAKIIAVDGLSRRVADAAGVQYTEPELQANLPWSVSGSDAFAYRAGHMGADHGGFMIHGSFPSTGQGDSGVHGYAEEESTAPPEPVMDYIEPADRDDVTAEGLGRRLDALYQQLTAHEDGFALLDLMLTRRTGMDASLPSYSPVDYPYQSSSFGWRRNPVTGRHSMHEGLDFAAPRGAPIYAASSGVVTQARFRSGYGNLVEIAHGNGLSTRYAHASALKVEEGDLVEKGQQIALVGSTGRSTGPHLHFEVRMAGHPLDPTLFLTPQPPSKQFVADAGEHVSTVGTQVR